MHRKHSFRLAAILWSNFSTVACSSKSPSVDKSSIELDDQDSGGTDWDQQEEFEEDLTPDIIDGPRIDTGKTSWGTKALELARRVLEGPKLNGLDLYAFRAVANGSLLDIRLDKLEDEYGSPTLEEVADFSREFYGQLENELGEEEAGKISVEVSSPGAEREVKIPEEINRFSSLPMSVTYLWVENGKEKKDTRVLQILPEETTEETSMWQLANVKFNRPQGRQNLTKKQQAQKFQIPIANIARVNLFIEI